MPGYPYRQVKLLIICVSIIFCFTAISIMITRTNCYSRPQNEYVYKVPEKTDDGWETSSLREESVDPERINELIVGILNEKYKKIHSVLLVKNGKLILEEYFHGYNREKLHEIRSATKSIGSILTGIAIDHRFINDVNEKIYPYFKDYEPCLLYTSPSPRD